jgi:hypothetical protein
MVKSLDENVEKINRNRYNGKEFREPTTLPPVILWINSIQSSGRNYSTE